MNKNMISREPTKHMRKQKLTEKQTLLNTQIKQARDKNAGKPEGIELGADEEGCGGGTVA